MPPPAPPPPPQWPYAGRNNRARRRAAKRDGRKKSQDAADVQSPSSSLSFSSQAPQPQIHTSNPTFVTGSDTYHHINQPAHDYSAQQQQQQQQPEDELRQVAFQQQQQRPPKQLTVEEAYGPDFYGSKELGFCYLHPDEPAFWLAGNEAAQRLVLGRNPNLAADSAPKMADPFEVRMRFSGQLQHLNATVVSAQKAAQYAVKYRDLSEDLHSCILEQLEKVRP